MPALVAGEYHPESNRERLDLARECQLQKRYTLATPLYADAFAADPKLADDLPSFNRYHAACSAALAGCGEGEGPDTLKETLSEADRARWRKQARDWLRADLVLYVRQMAGSPAKKAGVIEQLQRWLEDGDLAAVRDAAKLTQLPEAERKEWETFWAELKGRVNHAPAVQ